MIIEKNHPNSLKILVTGGAGFIGRYLADYLLESHAITIYDNLSNSSKKDIEFLLQKGAKFVKGDVLDYQDLERSCRDFDLLIHLAAKTDVVDSIANPEDTLKTNVDGTKNVLKCCIASNIKKIIFASSAAVYDESQMAIDENYNTNPASPYGKSKLEAEKLIKKYSDESELDAITLRLFNIYGKGQNLQYAGVISKFISNVSNNLPIEINGDGKQTRDFVSVYDVVFAFDCAIKNISGKKGAVYNIGTGVAVSVNELAQMIQNISENKIQIKHKDAIVGEIKHSLADVSLAKDELGFLAKRKLKDELANLF